MNPALKGVWEYMRDQATGALAHANRHSCYFDPGSPWWSEQAVLQAAHAGELFLKARIAQEHPLLIFEKLPKPGGDASARLDIKDLFERGITYQWSELPARLWATTGIRLVHEDLFVSFGKLRNMIQHFAVPHGRDLSSETIDFVFKVLDPFINKCWGLCAIDYDEDDAPYEYLTRAVMDREILFNVSAAAAVAAANWSVDWDEMTPSYRREMQRRVEAAWPDLKDDAEKKDFLSNMTREKRSAWKAILGAESRKSKRRRSK